MDDHRPDVSRPFPGWLEWAIIIALVVVVVIISLVVLGTQTAGIFTQLNDGI